METHFCVPCKLSFWSRSTFECTPRIIDLHARKRAGWRRPKCFVNLLWASIYNIFRLLFGTVMKITTHTQKQPAQNRNDLRISLIQRMMNMNSETSRSLCASAVDIGPKINEHSIFPCSYFTSHIFIHFNVNMWPFSIEIALKRGLHQLLFFVFSAMFARNIQTKLTAKTEIDVSTNLLFYFCRPCFINLWMLHFFSSGRNQS